MAFIQLRRSTALAIQHNLNYAFENSVQDFWSHHVRVGHARVGADVNNTIACPPCSCPSTFWKDLMLVVCFGAASALGATLIGKVL